jgi:hypothetical protein
VRHVDVISVMTSAITAAAAIVLCCIAIVLVCTSQFDIHMLMHSVDSYCSYHCVDCTEAMPCHTVPLVSLPVVDR